MNTDFIATNHGSLVTLEPRTKAAETWVASYLPKDVQWFAGAVVIEPRYFGDIAAGLVGDGLTWRAA